MADQNGNGAKVRYIHRPNTLKMKVGGAPDSEAGMVDPVDLERARNAVREMAETYPAEVEGQLQKLQELYEAAASGSGSDRYDALVEIRDIAHEIRGVAGTFGYAGCAKFATSLFDFTRSPDSFSDAHVMVVKIHVDAIRVLLRGGRSAETGPEITELTNSLKLAISRLSTRRGR
ncbi:MAG: hypothetical protein CMM50_05085 [Rhodospirillaceae bacterium]|nr:hypothetical protein [Rhodospirillaceae bacterium]